MLSHKIRASGQISVLSSVTWGHYGKHLCGWLLSRVVYTFQSQVEELQVPAGLHWRHSSHHSVQHTLLLSGQPQPAAAGALQPCPAVLLPDQPAAAYCQPHQSTGPAVKPIMIQTQHPGITLHQACSIQCITEGTRFGALPSSTNQSHRAHSCRQIDASSQARP